MMKKIDSRPWFKGSSSGLHIRRNGLRAVSTFLLTAGMFVTQASRAQSGGVDGGSSPAAAPAAVCQNLTVNANASCQAVVPASSFDGGSTDPGGMPLAFTASPAGPYPLGTTNVTLTVSSISASSTCTATVTVVDDAAPALACVDRTFYVGEGGTTTLRVVITRVAALNNVDSDGFFTGNSDFEWQWDMDALSIGSPDGYYFRPGDNGPFSQTVSSMIYDQTMPSSTVPATLDFQWLAHESDVAVVPANVSGDGSTGVKTALLTVPAAPGTLAQTFTAASLDGGSPQVYTLTAQIQRIDVGGSPSLSPVFLSGLATDNCGVASVTASQTSFGCEDVGVNPVTITATDVNGNVSTCSLNVTILDTVAPVLSSLPAPAIVYCPAVPSFSIPSATDNCSATLTFADVVTPGGCPGSYSITRTWTATDAGGNTATASQSFTVIDNVAPVFAALPAASTVFCPATPVFATPVVTDACGVVNVTHADAVTPGDCAGNFNITRTWTATDGCNTSTASQTILVRDITGPAFTHLPADLTVECDGSGNTADLAAWLASQAGASASDDCGAGALIWSNSFSGFPGGITGTMPCASKVVSSSVSTRSTLPVNS